MTPPPSATAKGKKVVAAKEVFVNVCDGHVKTAPKELLVGSLNKGFNCDVVCCGEPAGHIRVYRVRSDLD